MKNDSGYVSWKEEMENAITRSKIRNNLNSTTHLYQIQNQPLQQQHFQNRYYQNAAQFSYSVDSQNQKLNFNHNQHENINVSHSYYSPLSTDPIYSNYQRDHLQFQHNNPHNQFIQNQFVQNQSIDTHLLVNNQPTLPNTIFYPKLIPSTDSTPIPVTNDQIKDKKINVNNSKSQKHQPFSARIDKIPTLHLLITGYSRKEFQKTINDITCVVILFYGDYTTYNTNVVGHNQADIDKYGFYVSDYNSEKIIHFRPKAIPNGYKSFHTKAQCIGNNVTINPYIIQQYNQQYRDILETLDLFHVLFLQEKSIDEKIKKTDFINYSCILYNVCNESIAFKLDLPKRSDLKHDITFVTSIYSSKYGLLSLSDHSISSFCLKKWKWNTLSIGNFSAKGIGILDNENKIFMARSKKPGCCLFDLESLDSVKVKWPKGGLGGAPAICCDDTYLRRVYVLKNDHKVDNAENNFMFYDIGKMKWQQLPVIGIKEILMTRKYDIKIWIGENKNIIYAGYGDKRYMNFQMLDMRTSKEWCNFTQFNKNNPGKLSFLKM